MYLSVLASSKARLSSARPVADSCPLPRWRARCTVVSSYRPVRTSKGDRPVHRGRLRPSGRTALASSSVIRSRRRSPPASSLSPPCCRGLPPRFLGEITSAGRSQRHVRCRFCLKTSSHRPASVSVTPPVERVPACLLASQAMWTDSYPGEPETGRSPIRYLISRGGLSNRKFREIEFSDGGEPVVSSLTGSQYDPPMFRYLDQVVLGGRYHVRPRPVSR